MNVWGMSVIRSVRRQLRRIVARRPVRDDLLAQRVARAETRLDACERKTAAIVATVGETAAIAGVSRVTDNDETIPQLRIVGGESRLCGAAAAVAAGSASLVPLLLDAEPDFLTPAGQGPLFPGGERRCRGRHRDVQFGRLPACQHQPD
jgi:hypothetical protein